MLLVGICLAVGVHLTAAICELTIKKRMLICIACGNGSFGYKIKPIKQGGIGYVE